MQTSVLTLVRGRRDHLTQLMNGLSRQESKPSEFIIAWMQPEPLEDLPDPGCPVRHVLVAGDALPLAKARNRAAEAAEGELLIFLDVDCIPSPGLVSAYQAAAASRNGLFLGEVLYLPAGASRGPLDFAELDRVGVTHPSKPAVPPTGVRAEPDVGQLWGLSFALHRQDYASVGGMSEDFEGYGGEETDFATRLGKAGLPFFWTAGARSYHQHHPVSVPPLQHFDAILRNATLFHRRHGRWCMDYWLGQFAAAGLIAWSSDAAGITVVRRPTQAEITAAAADTQRIFS